MGARYRAQWRHVIATGADFGARDPVTREWECASRAPMLKRERADLLAAMIADGQYIEGLPRAERPAAIAQLERELAELEAAEEQFVDGLLAQGIVVEHRPEVAQRRETERRQAEQREATEATRKAREDQINQHHAAQPRVAYSQYVGRRQDPEIPSTP